MLLPSPELSAALASTTQEYDAIRHATMCVALGEATVAQALQEIALDEEIFASLTDEEQELYLDQEQARGEDESRLNELLDLPQSHLQLGLMAFVGDSVAYFHNVDGYQFGEVEPGLFRLVRNPLDMDNNVETLLDANIRPDGIVEITKKYHYKLADEFSAEPFGVEPLVVENTDVMTLKAALVRLRQIIAMHRSELELAERIR